MRVMVDCTQHQKEDLLLVVREESEIAITAVNKGEVRQS